MQSQKLYCKFHRSYKKVVPKERSVSLPKLRKVVPKGAQSKFSSQKSFQRECRAKYRRNIRRRSSKVVPKGMQNLYHRNRRRRSSKVIPKGMQNLYHRNKRRRSSKDVPKGMQNLYHRNRRWRSSKVVPKGMQSLCVPVWVCGCVASASSSFCIILSHHSA